MACPRLRCAAPGQRATRKSAVSRSSISALQVTPASVIGEGISRMPIIEPPGDICGTAFTAQSTVTRKWWIALICIDVRLGEHGRLATLRTWKETPNAD
jgi:hypothetical protein